MNLKANVHPLKEGPKPVGDSGKVELVAMASVTLDDTWAVENIRVLRSTETGDVFPGMPQYKRGEEWKDVAHPITKEANAALRQAIKEAYEAIVNTAG